MLYTSSFVPVIHIYNDIRINIKRTRIRARRPIRSPSIVCPRHMRGGVRTHLATLLTVSPVRWRHSITYPRPMIYSRVSIIYHNNHRSDVLYLTKSATLYHYHDVVVLLIYLIRLTTVINFHYRFINTGQKDQEKYNETALK